MPLIKCHECNKELSDIAAKCPHCGASKKRDWSKIFFTAFGISLIFILVSQKPAHPPESIPTKNSTPQAETTPDKISDEATDKIEKEKQSIKNKYSKMKTESFCKEIGKTLRAPIEKRNQKKSVAILELAAEKYSVVAADYTPIENRSPRIGMHWCALVAAIGEPERINRTVLPSGERQQWVYGRHNYIYLDDGTVTAWQD